MIFSIILIIFSLIQLCRPYKKKNTLFYIGHISMIIGSSILLVVDLTGIKNRALDIVLIITIVIIVGTYLYTKLTTYKKNRL